MNTKKLKFLCAALLSINLMQSPVQATILNDNQTFYPNIAQGTGVAVILYVGYNYLIRQEYLVKNKFPVAQAWYDALAQKYPAAHLDQKQFVQKPKLSLIPDALADFAKSCNWSSNHDYIYFKDTDLGTITTLYQKVLDGYPLHPKEQLTLASKEFMILHEAGHIEHDDAKDIMITIFGLLFLTHGTQLENAMKKETPEDYNLIEIDLSKYNIDYTIKKLTIPGIMTIPQAVAFMTGLIAMLRYQESRADKFAYTMADDNTLKGAITIFEDEDNDKLYDLENKKMTPFIKTDSTIGNVIQTVVGPVEFIASVLVQQFFLLVKSMPESRWVFDFTQNQVHQGPSVRAQAIKDELARREHNQQN